MCIRDRVYDAEFNKCMDLIERPDLIGSPVYSSYNKVLAEGRVTEVVNLIEEGFMKKDADEWVRIFKEKDTPAGKCFTVDDILSDPQAWENDFLRKIHYDNGVDGIVTDTPVRFQSMGCLLYTSRGGENISSVEIEGILMLHENIIEAAVVSLSLIHIWS